MELREHRVGEHPADHGRVAVFGFAAQPGLGGSWVLLDLRVERYTRREGHSNARNSRAMNQSHSRPPSHRFLVSRSKACA